MLDYKVKGDYYRYFAECATRRRSPTVARDAAVDPVRRAVALSGRLRLPAL